MDSRVIIIGGLPGTGKTTIAEALSSELGITLLSKDLLEAAIVRSGIATKDTLQGVGYELLSTMAMNELSLGRSVILDCVAPLNRVNEFWTDLLSKEIRYIECICSDTQLHKARVSSRVRGIPGWYEVSWKDITRIKALYQPFSKSRLIVDSSDPLDKNTALTVEYVRSSSKQPLRAINVSEHQPLSLWSFALMESLDES